MNTIVFNKLLIIWPIFCRRKSESLPGRGRKRSPVPVRKGQGEVSFQTPSTVVQSTASGAAATLPHGYQGLQDEMSVHASLPNVEDDFVSKSYCSHKLSTSSPSFFFLGCVC